MLPNCPTIDQNSMKCVSGQDLVWHNSHLIQGIRKYYFHYVQIWICEYCGNIAIADRLQSPNVIITDQLWAWTITANGWSHHEMETFSALLVICAGNSLVTSEFPTNRPVTWSFHIFFDLLLNKWLSKQWWGWWFEMPSHPLWRYCEEYNENSRHQLHQME